MNYHWRAAWILCVSSPSLGATRMSAWALQRPKEAMPDGTRLSSYDHSMVVSEMHALGHGGSNGAACCWPPQCKTSHQPAAVEGRTQRLVAARRRVVAATALHASNFLQQLVRQVLPARWAPVFETNMSMGRAFIVADAIGRYAIVARVPMAPEEQGHGVDPEAHSLTMRFEMGEDAATESATEFESQTGDNVTDRPRHAARSAVCGMLRGRFRQCAWRYFFGVCHLWIQCESLRSRWRRSPRRRAASWRRRRGRRSARPLRARQRRWPAVLLDT
jgi:hypothetical protein